MAIEVKSEQLKEPVVPTGTYGEELDESGQPTAYILFSRTENDDGTPRVAPWAQDQPLWEIVVGIRDAEAGLVRANMRLSLPKSEDEQVGNRILKTALQLGLIDQQTADEIRAGKAGLSLTEKEIRSVEGLGVVATVRTGPSKKDPEGPVYCNLTNVQLRTGG